MRSYFLQRLRLLGGISASTYAFTNMQMVGFGSDGSKGGRYSQSSHNVAPGLARFDTHVVSRDILGPRHITSGQAGLLDGRIWKVTALLDNHRGSATSQFLAANIVPAILGSLADLYSRNTSSEPQSSSDPSPEFRTIDDSPPNSDPTSEAIQAELVDTFLRMDDDLVNFAAMLAGNRTSKGSKSMEVLKPALSGSSALVTFYEVAGSNRTLHVAQTGGARALLGRAKNNGKYDVHVLGTTPSDERNRAALLEKAHPNEKKIVTDKKLFGLAPLRAFGFGPLKWSPEIRQRVALGTEEETWGQAKTPPYITAEPDVASIAIEKGDILIMASASLFASLSDREAIDIAATEMKEAKKSIKPAMGRVKLMGLGDDDSLAEVTLSALTGEWKGGESNIAKALADRADVNLGKEEALSIGVMVFD